MVVLLIALCLVLSLTIPCALYAGLRLGLALGARVSDPREEFPVEQDIPEQSVESSANSLNERLVSRFNEEIEALKRKHNASLEAKTRDGRKVHVSLDNLEPIFDDQPRNLEQIS